MKFGIGNNKIAWRIQFNSNGWTVLPAEHDFGI